MAGIMGVIAGDLKVSIVDSTMMSILHKAMDKAHDRVKSKEGIIERLHEISKFYELSVMQLDGCIKFVQLETNTAQNPDEFSHHHQILSGLTEIRNRLRRRLHDSDLAIRQKDREFTDRFENESKLRQALEITEKELVSSQEDLARSRSGESSNCSNLDDDDDDVEIENVGEFCDIDVLKESLDIAFGKMQSALFCSEMGPIQQQIRSCVENDVVSLCLKGFLRDSRVRFEEEKRNWFSFMDDVAGLCEDLKPLLAQNGAQDRAVLEFGSSLRRRDNETFQVDVGIDSTKRPDDKTSQVDVDIESSFSEHRINNDEKEQLDIDIDIDIDSSFSEYKKNNDENEQVDIESNFSKYKMNNDEKELVDSDSSFSEYKMNNDEKEQVDVDSSFSKYRMNSDEKEEEDIDSSFSEYRMTNYEKDKVDTDSSFFEYKMNNDEKEQVDIDRSFSEYRKNNDEKDKVNIDLDSSFSKYRMNNNENEFDKLVQGKQEMLKDQKTSLSSRRGGKSHVSLKSRFQEVLQKLEKLMILNAKFNKISDKNVDFNEEEKMWEQVDLTKNKRQKSDIETLADVWDNIHKLEDEENIIGLLRQERDDREFQNKMMEEIYITLFQGLREKFCNELSIDFIRNQLDETQFKDDIYEFGLDRSNDANDENRRVSSSRCLDCKTRQENMAEHTAESFLREEISWFLCLVLFKEMIKEWEEKFEESNLESFIKEEICYTVLNEVVENLSNKVEKTREQQFNKKLFVGELKGSLETLVSEEENVTDEPNKRKPESSKLNTSDSKCLKPLELPHVFYDFELRTNAKLDGIMLRLEEMKHSLDELPQAMASLRENEFLYKKAFLRRCQNLRKAENEVDLLGDQVDILLSLIEKIYLIMNQHSPILQQYFDVSEILRLIKKEVEIIVCTPHESLDNPILS